MGKRTWAQLSLSKKREQSEGCRGRLPGSLHKRQLVIFHSVSRRAVSAGVSCHDLSLAAVIKLEEWANTLIQLEGSGLISAPSQSPKPRAGRSSCTPAASLGFLFLLQHSHPRQSASRPCSPATLVHLPLALRSSS